MADQGEITDLTARLAQGEPGAAERLVPILDGELRDMARALMRGERVDHTLEPTALVNEAYLRLVDQERVDWQGKTHFLAIAAQAMRRVLVDHARARNRQKRQGDRKRVLLDASLPACGSLVGVLEIDDALEALRKLDEEQHRIAELRLFGGLDTREVALLLGISEQVARREWRMASKWLEGKLSGESR